MVDCVWNVMAHAQKPDVVIRRNGRVHLNRRWRQFSRLLAAEVCASAVVMVVMLDTCSEVVWRVLPTHSICQFPLHFPSRASPCAITFQLDSNPCAVQFIRIWFTSNTTLFQTTLNADYLFINKLKAVCPFLLERIVRKSNTLNDVPLTSPSSCLVYGEY